jgi:hypothetical protein
MESVAAKGMAVGQGLEGAGAFAATLGLAVAGTPGTVPGALLMALGGATTLGSSLVQGVGGLLQNGSDPTTGWQNAEAGGASLLAGGTFAFAPAVFGLPGGNFLQRAFNRTLENQFAFGGAGVDTLSQALPGMDPQQATCP